MIPEFNENGELPKGIHEATLEEVEKRFCYNMSRKRIFEDFLKLLEEFKKINCKEIFIDGSFVSNTEFPNDLDICWGNNENIGSEYFR